MKKIFILLVPIISFANPEWFYNIKNEKNYIVGYGVAKELSEAKKRALEEITNSLSVSVDSSLDITSKEEDGDFSKNTSTSLKTNSKAVLSGVEYIKSDNLNGMWYVAAKYDNSSLDLKLKKLLPKILKNEIQNSYLEKTPLFLWLNKEIGKNLNYKIVRKDNLWQLKYNDILIPIDTQSFYKLFSNQESKEIVIVPNKKIYKQNDEMFFNINHNHKGFVSILYVEHNGKVGVLLSNKTSSSKFMFPDVDEEKFKIVNPYSMPIRELYIAIYSNTPIDLNVFENVSEDLLDESNYNFDKLLNLLDKHKYSTYEIKIKK